MRYRISDIANLKNTIGYFSKTFVDSLVKNLHFCTTLATSGALVVDAS
jgi:hypothetical protein